MAAEGFRIGAMTVVYSRMISTSLAVAFRFVDPTQPAARVKEDPD
ncbi:hypothetical protein [Actinoplanes sp. NPDC049802]